jgi:protein O-GlcNAc transferase
MTTEDIQEVEAGEGEDEGMDVPAFRPSVLYENISSKKDKRFYELLVEILDQILTGETFEAVDATEKLFSKRPDAPELFFALGLAYWSLHDYGKAIEMVTRSHETDPDCRDYVDALASIHTLAGKLTDGLYYAKLATVLEPHRFIDPLLPPILSNYFTALNSTSASRHYVNGLIQFNERRFEAALIELEAELSINPNNFDCLLLCGTCLNELNRYDEALAVLKRAVSLDNNSADPLIEAGKSLYHLGMRQDAVETHLIALGLDLTIENCAAAMDGLQYLGSELSAEKDKIRLLMEECFNAIEKFPLVEPRGEKENSDLIHIGFFVNSIYGGEYYSIFEPILRRRDRTKFKVIIYKTSVAEDALFTQIKNNVDLIRPVFDIDPETLSVILTNDKIDVLIDLSGYSDGSQYTILKQGIAPIQIGHLRHPYGIDAPGSNFIISDNFTAASDKEQVSDGCEIITTGDGLYAFEPFTNFPDPIPSPALNNGFVTFGCYCDLATLTPEVATSWIKILQDIPTAHLLFGGVPNICNLVKEIVVGMFSDKSVANRINFLDADSTQLGTNVDFYNSIDIYLDSFRGGTTKTVVESLWMGVPVITMTGPDRSSLISGSVLTAAGKSDWITTSTSAYGKLAKSLSSDITSLSKVRKNLRSELENSSLFNADQMTRSWEAALISCLEKTQNKK